MTAPLDPTRLVIPTIETERTILRAHRRDDFDAYATMWADPDVTRFIGQPRSRSESWQKFLRHAGMWMMTGHGTWAIADRATGAFVGEAGYHQLMRDMVPNIDGLPEIGWVIVPAMQGRGLASEVARAVVAWGDAELHASRTTCIISPAHTASLSIAGRLGYHDAVEVRLDGSDVLLLSRNIPARG